MKILMRKNLCLVLSLVLTFIFCLANVALAVDWVTTSRIGNPDAQIELTFWDHTSWSIINTVETAANVLRDRFESWARKNPNVKINTSIYAGHAINENMVRLLLATEAGQAPDIAFIDSFFVPRFINAGLLEPIEEYCTEEELKDFPATFTKSVSDSDGHLRALWISTDVRVLYYRKDLVPQPPETWDELFKMGKELMESNKDVKAFLLYPGGMYENTSFYFYPMFWSRGGKLIDDDGAPIFNQGRNREYMLDVLNFIKKTIDTGLTPKSIVTMVSDADVLAEAVASNAAMIIGGSWVNGMLKQIFSPEEFENWEVALLPQISADVPDSTGAGGWTVAVLTKDPQKKAIAFNFIWNAFGAVDAMADICIATAGWLPTRSSIYDKYETFTSDKVSSKFGQYLKSAQVRSGALIYPDLSLQLQTAIGKVIVGTATPEQALDEAWSNVMQIYEKM